MQTSDTFVPAGDEEARVVGGRINHVAATNSSLSLYRGRTSGGTIFFTYAYIPSTTCTDSFTFPPQLPTVAKMDEEDVGDGKDIWFDQRVCLLFNSAASGRANVIIEVRKIDPSTGLPLA